VFYWQEALFAEEGYLLRVSPKLGRSIFAPVTGVL
jgi:hypothetical protein